MMHIVSLYYDFNEMILFVILRLIIILGAKVVIDQPFILQNKKKKLSNEKMMTGPIFSNQTIRVYHD